MRKKLVGIFVCMLLITTGTIAVADWDEEDGHKMHWPQLPDPNGWDVYCTAGLLPQWPEVCLADDWQCPESGWIKDIHFWGSWYRDIVGIIDYFVIGIAENIPEDPPQNPYSKPGETLVEWEIHDWIERGPYTGDQGWYWSYLPQWEPDDHQLYWQYNVFLDEEDWFWQEEGEIYWLFISAIVKAEPVDQPLWGWKSTYEDLHFMDDAVWGRWYELYWIPLTYPSGLTMDLAFVVTAGMECNPSIDVLKHVKNPKTGEWVDASSPGDAVDIKIGEIAEFKIVLTNDGEPPLDGIVVNDTMEGGLEYISATPPPSSTDPLQWKDLEPLEAGETQEIIVRAKVVGEHCNYYYQKVWGYALCACGEPGCNCPPQYYEYYAYIHAYEKARSVNRPIFNFLENYQNLFPILWLLLQRLGLQ